MEAKDLRIGSYYHQEGFYKLERNKSRIDIPDIDFILNKKTLIFLLTEGELDYITPIPLTEEWLLKFGFFEDNTYLNIGEVRYYIGEFGTYLDEQVWWNEEIISDHIKHVHQLQNLYHALTNEELNHETKRLLPM